MDSLELIKNNFGKEINDEATNLTQTWSSEKMNTCATLSQDVKQGVDELNVYIRKVVEEVINENNIGIENVLETNRKFIINSLNNLIKLI